MTFEEMPEEWPQWLTLTCIGRFRQSKRLFARYLATGGGLDPHPDPASPSYDPETSGSAYRHQGEFAQAIEKYRAVLAQQTDFRPAQAGLG
jgi:hypothetical protein